MWVLLFIYFFDATTPVVEKVSQHSNMHECFYAREALSEKIGTGNGYFLPQQQAICINMNETDL
tara:strand:- start:482 stop:673 length:192 start_codon:yes stop_codon:yes gene_type:complete